MWHWRRLLRMTDVWCVTMQAGLGRPQVSADLIFVIVFWS